ncbi:MAG: alpha/beta hydrolase family protein [Verrucomicrobiota bacterium]
MITWTHDVWSRMVDGAAFGFINLLQLRAKAGTHDARAMEDYIRQWEGASLQDYYAIPAEREFLKLPESGVGRFPSAHITGCAENDMLCVEIWPGPRGKKSPAMILSHGFMSVSDVGYRIWAKHLNRLGWTAVFFHLPYHYGRKPKGTLSGEIAISANLIRTAEAIRQGVMDLRLLCRSLKAQGASKVGCWATSYGGWLASLACVVEPQLDTAWLIEPMTDIHHAIWKSPAARTMRHQLKKRSISSDMVNPHMRFVCPSYHNPVIPADHILLIAGIFDETSPVQSINGLHQKWAGSHYAELRQGHVGYQLMPASWRLAKESMPQLFV